MSVQLSGLDWFLSINKKIEKVVHTGKENIASLVLISQDKLDTAVAWPIHQLLSGVNSVFAP